MSRDSTQAHGAESRRDSNSPSFTSFLVNKFQVRISQRDLNAFRNRHEIRRRIDVYLIVIRQFFSAFYVDFISAYDQWFVGEERLDVVEQFLLLVKRMATLFGKVHEIENRRAQMRQCRNCLHLDRVPFLQTVVQYTGRVYNLRRANQGTGKRMMGQSERNLHECRPIGERVRYKWATQSKGYIFYKKTRIWDSVISDNRIYLIKFSVA